MPREGKGKNALPCLEEREKKKKKKKLIFL